MTEEWIKKMWYIYTMDYFSAIQKNEIVPFAATWMDLDSIRLSEEIREGKISYDIPYIENLKRNGINTNELTKQKETQLNNSARR